MTLTFLEGLVVWGLVLVALLVAARTLRERMRADEVLQRAPERAWRPVDPWRTAPCELCQVAGRVPEWVPLADGGAWCCASCADVLRPTRRVA